MFRLPLLGLFLAAALGAQSPLVTTFAHNVFGLPNGAVYFDLDVFVPSITVTRLDLNMVGAGTVEIYTKNGSRTGSITNPGAWTLSAVGIVGGSSAGAQTAVQVPPFVLAQGTHGIAIRGLGLQLLQTVGTGANQYYNNGSVALSAGEQTIGLFAAPVISPRVPNLALHYLVGQLAPIPAHVSNQNGQSAGFNFVAQTDFNIRQLALPTQAFQNGDTASYVVRVDGGVVYRSRGNLGAVDVNIHVQLGQSVDVIGNWSPAAAGQNSAHVSAAAPAPYQTNINGVQHTLHRVGWTWDIGAANWTELGGTGFYVPPSSTSAFGRVLMTTEPGALFATNLPLGSGCVKVTGSCYEQMPAPGFDLEFSAITFTPQAGGGYVVTRAGALLPVGATSAPQVLPLTDDNEVTMPFTAASFPGWTNMTICSNGIVSKATGNGTYWNPYAPSMLDAPQTAFWSWHDFDPTRPGSGVVKLEQSASVAVITWDGVWNHGGLSPTSASTTQFQLYGNGTVTIAWGLVSNEGNDHLVGYSPGGRSPSTAPIDLSTLAVSPLTLPGTERLPLALTAVSRPVVGTNWELIVEDVPPIAVLGVDVLGLSDPGFDDLTLLGMPNCGLRASLDVLQAWLPAGSTHPRSLYVPNVVALRGTTVFATTAVFTSPALNAFGAITSNGMRGQIGDL